MDGSVMVTLDIPTVFGFGRMNVAPCWMNFLPLHKTEKMHTHRSLLLFRYQFLLFFPLKDEVQPTSKRVIFWREDTKFEKEGGGGVESSATYCAPKHQYHPVQNQNKYKGDFDFSQNSFRLELYSSSMKSGRKKKKLKNE